MEFEDMQVVWNSQNNERMYVIDEAALHKRVRQKSRGVNRKVQIFEWLLIGLNLVVGLMLLLDAVFDNELWSQYLVAAVYLFFSIVGLVRRLSRRQDEKQFDNTMLGELDKAIWQIDYLIAQGHMILRWYLLPLVIVFSINSWLSAEPLWLSLLYLILLPAGYYGGRWEMNKWHLPKKRGLESLRETLTSAPDTAVSEVHNLV